MKTRRIVVAFPQLRLGSLDLVERPHQRLQPSMFVISGLVPIEALIMIPFTPLSKLDAQEKHFFAGPR